jgi:hypothetical protein
MKRTIVVIDVMGGGIGVQLIGKIRKIIDEDTEIIALGTNTVTTERMVKADAYRGAAGENALRVSVPPIKKSLLFWKSVIEYSLN